MTGTPSPSPADLPSNGERLAAFCGALTRGVTLYEPVLRQIKRVSGDMRDRNGRW